MAKNVSEKRLLCSQDVAILHCGVNSAFPGGGKMGIEK